MGGGLLNLSFHGDGTMAEDLLFKRTAIGEKFVFDVMDKAGDPPPALMRLAGTPGSGLFKKVESGTSVITLGSVGAGAWARPPFQKSNGADSVLDTWLKKVLSEPVECLILAGHHLGPPVWGLEDEQTKFAYTALVPHAADKTISIRGYRNAQNPNLLRGGPYDVSTAFSQCRLLMVWGCHAVETHPMHWAEWRTLIANCNGNKPPLILGFYKTHKWPRDASPERFSAHFVQNLRALGASATLTELCATKPREVIEAWANAMSKAFKNSTHCNKHMVFEDKVPKGCKGYPGRGAGGIQPDGKILHVVNQDGRLEAQN